MTPKIVTRLANIAAKLAGSDKYDPTIEPVTAFEYYLNKGVDKILAIKGVPAAEVGDKGKVLSVSSSGAPVWEDKGPLVVVFSGTSDDRTAACDKTWSEISAAGKNVQLWYRNAHDVYFQLNAIISDQMASGSFYSVDDTETLMYYIYVTIDSDAHISCAYVE